jgi:hypothetical protein
MLLKNKANLLSNFNSGLFATPDKLLPEYHYASSVGLPKPTNNRQESGFS